jgi:hypothetical protein
MKSKKNDHLFLDYSISGNLLYHNIFVSNVACKKEQVIQIMKIIWFLHGRINWC